MDEFKYGEVVYSRWRCSADVFRFRQGSVPGIRKWRWCCNCYRNPPHRYEEANKYIDDGDVSLNLTAQQINHLKKYHWVPDPWDDIPRARQGDTWKNYRKTRYK